jgi:plastocyanin
MKIRYSLSLLAVAAIAVALVSCGKSNESTTEQPASTATAPTGQPVDAATAGTITGTIKLDGTPPKEPKINMSAEAYCVTQHPSPVTADDVVTGSGGTLANVVVYIQDDMSKWAFTAPTSPAEIDQKGCLYNPHIVAMIAGQNLEVVNSDNTTHNIHPVPKDNREWNESQPPGSAPIMKVFARPEDAIPVKCNVHPWMKAYIFVFGNPYFSVTGDDGKFTISNVPPGTYNVGIWQEKYGLKTQSVTVGAKETKTVDASFSAAGS